MVKSDYFTLEKDVVDDLYYGILIATVRVCYRFTKYFLKNRIRQLKVK